MRTARAQADVALDPGSAMRLWTDLRRWPSFVEGFAHALEVSDDWPDEGSMLVWRSGPGGRGHVTEKVVERSARRIRTEVHEEALGGEQTVSFAPLEDGPGSRAELRLEYRLSRTGALRALADALFIRRALRDSMRRTLARFAAEAADDASLRGSWRS